MRTNRATRCRFRCLVGDFGGTERNFFFGRDREGKGRSPGDAPPSPLLVYSSLFEETGRYRKISTWSLLLLLLLMRRVWTLWETSGLVVTAAVAVCCSWFLGVGRYKERPGEQNFAAVVDFLKEKCRLK